MTRISFLQRLFCMNISFLQRSWKLVHGQQNMVTSKKILNACLTRTWSRVRGGRFICGPRLLWIFLHRFVAPVLLWKGLAGELLRKFETLDVHITRKTKDQAIDQSCSWSRFQRFNQESPQLPGPFRRPALYTKILLTKEYPQSIGFGNSPPLALKKSTTTSPFRFALPIHFSTRKAHLVLCSSFPTWEVMQSLLAIPSLGCRYNQRLTESWFFFCPVFET